MPNRLDKYPQAVKEALGYFEAFRRLGYPPEDIYFAVSGPAGHAHSVLRSQGLQFICNTGILPAKYWTQEASAALWKEAAEMWNTVQNSERMSIWNFSHAKQNATGMLVALHEKGFRWKVNGKQVMN